MRILELRSVRGTGGGPEKTILLGAQRADPRFPVTVCYIRDRRDTTFGIAERAARLLHARFVDPAPVEHHEVFVVPSELVLGGSTGARPAP